MRSPIATGLAIGAVGIALGVGTLFNATTARALFIGSGFTAAGVIFFGYSIFAWFYLRRGER